MSSIASSLRENLPRKALLALVLVSLGIRIVHWCIGAPKSYPDSTEYASVAVSLTSGDFHEYTGERTPVYPLFLLLCGMENNAVWVMQSLLGVATSLLLFAIVMQHTGDPALGLLAGLFHSLSINILFFESAILGESLTTFLLTLSLYLLFRILASTSDSPTRILACGAVVSLAALSKPLLLYLPFLCGVVLIVHWFLRRKPLRDGLRLASDFLLPTAVLILGWSTFNKATVNYWGPTTLLGYNLTQHSGQMMEDAPDEFATIRDIFLKQRETQRKQTGTTMFAVFAARPDMMKTTGLSVPELSKVLTTIALRLFIDHPFTYLGSVFESWKLFWTVPIYWDRYAISPHKMGRLVETMWKGEEKLLLALRLAFVGIVIVGGASAAVRRNISWRRAISIPWVLGATVLSASVVQGCFEAGENARYSIPFQSLMITVVLFAIVRTVLPSGEPDNPRS